MEKFALVIATTLVGLFALWMVFQVSEILGCVIAGFVIMACVLYSSKDFGESK